jgi:hypothetical protein
MDTLRTIFEAAFSINNIWWLVIKASIWFAIALIIIIKTDSPDPEKSLKNLKSTLGFFLMFIALTGGLLYLLFGQVPA